MKLGLGLGLAVGAWGGLHAWNKHDFCRGWSEHYAARAEALRAEAEVAGLSPEAAHEHRVAADMQDRIALRYATVARQPWRSYPDYPLATPAEMNP